MTNTPFIGLRKALGDVWFKIGERDDSWWAKGSVSLQGLLRDVRGAIAPQP